MWDFFIEVEVEKVPLQLELVVVQYSTRVTVVCVLFCVSVVVWCAQK